MDAARLIRRARLRAGMSLRDLGRAAGTSHSTLAAYEAGRKMPSFATLVRVVRAAGFEVDLSLAPAVGGGDPAGRGRELEEVLALAEEFPARHQATMTYPVFGSS